MNMEIISSRHFIKRALKEDTFQNAFPETVECKKCGKNMKPVFVYCDDEGILVKHRPELADGEFWFHDAVAIAVYLCVSVDCAEMTALWNQA